MILQKFIKKYDVFSIDFTEKNILKRDLGAVP